MDSDPKDVKDNHETNFLFFMDCPTCGSQHTFRNGNRFSSTGEQVQRWLCADCGHRFSECITKPMFHVLSSQIGAYEVKNLALLEGEEKTGDIIGKLVEFSFWMQRQGYKESTTVSRGHRLRRLVKLGANLWDPESIKEIIATQKNWSEARKLAMVHAYNLFARWQGIKWQKPFYKPPYKLPFIPMEREIDDLIAGCNQHIATFLRIGKETGARAGEIFGLKWTDIDLENKTIRVTPEKNSNPRQFKISNTLYAMLQKLSKDDAPFSHYANLAYLRRSFERYRQRSAQKFGNPRLRQITFHTLRHWKATMEYHKTKDILYVMRLLGHRNIKNTLIYTQLIDGILEDEFVCKVAKNPNEIQELVEAGYEYICETPELKFFRKRK